MLGLILGTLLFSADMTSSLLDSTRWTIRSDHSIEWKVRGSNPHEDHVEMSGLKVSAIVRYGVDATGNLKLTRHVVWPMLRTVPNNTHASLSHDFALEAFPRITFDGQPLASEKPKSFQQRGLLTIVSRSGPLEITRTLFPSRTLPALLEKVKITNRGAKAASLSVSPFGTSYTTDPKKNVDGPFHIECQAQGDGEKTLAPGASHEFCLVFKAAAVAAPVPSVNIDAELKDRVAYIDSLWKVCVLETPDPVLNSAFRFSKIRAAESIYATKGGLMHGPGGGSYYAALWANDQAEYASPYFAYLGDKNGEESGINCYRHYARFMNPEYKPIPSSIIAEGVDTWHGAGDRGDAAMIAHGAARYAMSCGDREKAEELWPLIEWCLEFCNRKLNSDGVIDSDSDELEGRFPAGQANLSTACLAYDALLSAEWLSKELDKPNPGYAKRAEKLKSAINRFFGVSVEGFETYRYFAENTTLRAWICLPLAMGIEDRAKGTLDALFSPKLWTIDGLATEAGKPDFWDRSTLYALRGAFAAGDTERALHYLKQYSTRRHLSEHVPYPVEAYPEGGQRHLSAESALYGRIYMEGMFGYRPTGLHSFVLNPRLPANWSRMALRGLHTSGAVLDVVVSRRGKAVQVQVLSGKKVIAKGSAGPIEVRLSR